MKEPAKFRFYATLLDSFQSYLSSNEIYQLYYGFAEEPSISPEEFEKKKFQELINSINRVPLEDTEAADRGTAFNEIVDSIIIKRKSDKMEIVSDKLEGVIRAKYNERVFTFPIHTCVEFANYFEGATSQVKVEALLPTSYGNVLLYGYIDELMPASVHDIKTTSKYSIGKYRNNWQHKVYPYCLHEMGTPLDEFEYNIAEISKSGKITSYTEHYLFRYGRDTAMLIDHCERLIEFINANRSLITDTRIFGEVDICGQTT